MARSRKGDSALIALLIVVGFPLWLLQNHPVIAVLVFALLIAAAVAFARSRHCELCGVGLKRTVYSWEIDGQQKRVCPNCNRTLERRQSNRALGRF